MNELELLMGEFSEALRGIPEAFAEVEQELKRWGNVLKSATETIATIPAAIGGKLQEATSIAGNAIRQVGTQAAQALAPALNQTTAAVKAAGGTFATLTAPIAVEFRILASVANDVGSALRIMGSQAAADLHALGAAIAPVVSGFAKLVSGGISTAFAALTPALGAVQSGFISLASGVQGFTGLLTTATTGTLSTAFSSLTSMFGQLGGFLGTAGKGIASLATNPAANLSGAIGKAAAPTAGAAGALGGALGGIAGAVMGPLSQLAGVVTPFVQALNPSLMRLFNQALRDLMATFGTAFAPIIQHVAALFNELSATLAPAMRALAPILDNLASVMEGTLVPIIGMIADAFVALSPIIEFVTSIMASMSEAMRVVYTVFRSAIQVLYEVIAQMFGGVDLKNAANGIREAMQTLTKYFVQFAAYVAKALGYLDPFAKALQKNLKDLEGKAPGVKAAPENVHVTGLEQLSKDMAVAAFNAQAAGGTRKKSEAEFLEQLIKEVEEVKQNGKTLETFLKEILEKLQKAVVDGVYDDLNKVWEAVKVWWGGEKGRHDRLEEQAREMRERHGIPEPARPDPTFWDNLWGQP